MSKDISGIKDNKPLQIDSPNIYTEPIYKAIITYPLSKDELTVLLNSKTIVDTWGVALAIFSFTISITYYLTRPDYNEIIFWLSVFLWTITILVFFIGDKIDHGEKKEKVDYIKNFFYEMKDK